MPNLSSNLMASREPADSAYSNAAINNRWSGFLLGLVILVAVSAPAQTLVTLYTFSTAPNAYSPYGRLVRIGNSLYGTTLNGGSAGIGGAVWQLNSQDSEMVLHSFTGTPDGWTPYSGLIRDAMGNLYGTTAYGGDFGNGTVFKMTQTGAVTILYSFKGYPNDGGYPEAGLVRDASGNLYGTTSIGGAGSCQDQQSQIVGCGTIFMVTPSGTETVLHGFANDTSDGRQPIAGLARDSAGNLYGTTYFGGASGDGSVFKVTPAGDESLLYSYHGSPDGSHPQAGLTLGQGGLYGTTYDGGALNLGTVFRLSIAGQEAVLYSFTGTGRDGAHPTTDLLVDAAGNLFGTTEAGGGSNSPYCGAFGPGCGTIFELTREGAEKVLHRFTGYPNDGAYPLGDLLQDAEGNLYGTTWLGGQANGGIVFQLVP